MKTKSHRREEKVSLTPIGDGGDSYPDIALVLLTQQGTTDDGVTISIDDGEYHDQVIVLEVQEDRLILHVWDNVHGREFGEDPTHRIEIEKG